MKIATEWLTLVRLEFNNYSVAIFQKDFLAALTVAAVALPLALAFGVASGADAAAGLVTAIIAGIVMGTLGGSPHQISGPTGAMSAVLIVLASRDGLESLWLASMLAGMFMVILGILRLGKVVSLIPAPVISGFTSGIAVIIILGQIDNALGIQTPPEDHVFNKLRFYFEHGVHPNWHAIFITLLVAIVMIFWPRFKKGKGIPGSLAGIMLATLVVVLTGWQVPIIGNIPRSILLESRLTLDGIPWHNINQLLIPAMSIAALGTIESLLCGAVAGNMTGVRLHSSVELIAQGLGNMIIPFFGGVPATAAIARTSVNIKSGGVTRLAPILHGLILFFAAMMLAPIIGKIPMAALAGVLLITAWRMNEWHAIHFYFGKKLKHAIVAFIATLLATIFLDLTQAILIGFGISTLIFMAQVSDLQISRLKVDQKRLSAKGHQFHHPDNAITVYYLIGPLFFSSARKLIEELESHDKPDVTIIISMRGVPLIDATGIEVLREILKRQRMGHGDLLLAALQPRVENLLKQCGFWDEIGSQRIFWTADRAILSMNAELPTKPIMAVEKDDLDTSLVITPHQDRVDKNT